VYDTLPAHGVFFIGAPGGLHLIRSTFKVS